MLRLIKSTAQRAALPSVRGLHQSALLLSQRAATFAQLRKQFGREYRCGPSGRLMLICDHSWIRGRNSPRKGTALGLQVSAIRTTADEQQRE